MQSYCILNMSVYIIRGTKCVDKKNSVCCILKIAYCMQKIAWSIQKITACCVIKIAAHCILKVSPRKNMSTLHPTYINGTHDKIVSMLDHKIAAHGMVVKAKRNLMSVVM